jgi:heptaprenylglyceryl phosphate synthase
VCGSSHYNDNINIKSNEAKGKIKDKWRNLVKKIDPKANTSCENIAKKLLNSKSDLIIEIENQIKAKLRLIDNTQ